MFIAILLVQEKELREIRAAPEKLGQRDEGC